MTVELQNAISVYFPKKTNRNMLATEGRTYRIHAFFGLFKELISIE